MKVTIKGQVTIPLHIRKKYDINVNTEVEFIDKNGKIYLQKMPASSRERKNTFKQFRGTATVKMSTDEIMALTRGTG